MNNIIYTRFPSPAGNSIVASVNNKICWLSFNDNGSRFKRFVDIYINEYQSTIMQKNFERFKKHNPPIARVMLAKNVGIVEDSTPFKYLLYLLDDYFNGKEIDFKDINLVYLTGTGFHHRVWDALREIPYGEVRSYKEIAAAVDSPDSARAVGNACGANLIPLIIPCHRVLKADGTIGGFTGGLDIKRKLLAIEKVRYKETA